MGSISPSLVNQFLGFLWFTIRMTLVRAYMLITGTGLLPFLILQAEMRFKPAKIQAKR